MFPLLLSFLRLGGNNLTPLIKDFGNIAKRLSAEMFHRRRHGNGQNGHDHSNGSSRPLTGAASNFASLLTSLPANVPPKAPTVVPPPDNSGYALQGQSAAERRQVGAAPVPTVKPVPLPVQQVSQFQVILAKATQGLQKFTLPLTKLSSLFVKMFHGGTPAATGTAASAGTAVASAGTAVASAAGGLMQGGGDISMLLKLLAALATAFVTLPAALMKFVGLVSDSNRELSLWDARLAGSFAKLDILKTNLDIKTAAGTNVTASAVNQELGKLLEEIQPLRELAGNMLNLLATTIAQELTSMVSLMESAVTVVDNMFNLNIRNAQNALKLMQAIANAFAGPGGPLGNWLVAVRKDLGQNPNPVVPLPAAIGPRGNLPPLMPGRRMAPPRKGK